METLLGGLAALFLIVLLLFALTRKKYDVDMSQSELTEQELTEAIDACVVKKEEAKEKPKPIRKYSTMYGSLTSLCEFFKTDNWCICLGEVKNRTLNISKNGADKTVLTAEDYALIRDIMDKYNRGLLLVVPFNAYKKLEPNDKDILDASAEFVAVTNTRTLCAALNHTLDLRKSMDSYWRAYNKTL